MYFRPFGTCCPSVLFLWAHAGTCDIADSTQKGASRDSLCLRGGPLNPEWGWDSTTFSSCSDLPFSIPTTPDPASTQQTPFTSSLPCYKMDKFWPKEMWNDALKGLSSKAEEMIEKTKTSVGEMAAEKKAAAAAMIEAQASKTKDALFQTKSTVEGEIVEGANEAKAAAIDGFDKELATAEQTVQEGVQEIEKKADTAASAPAAGGAGFDPAALASSAIAGGLGNLDKEAEKVVDGAIKQLLLQVSQTVDTKIKEADQFVDQKREEVIKTVQDESQKATSGVSEQLGSVLGKAKGLLNF